MCTYKTFIEGQSWGSGLIRKLNKNVIDSENRDDWVPGNMSGNRAPPKAKDQEETKGYDQ